MEFCLRWQSFIFNKKRRVEAISFFATNKLVSGDSKTLKNIPQRKQHRSFSGNSTWIIKTSRDVKTTCKRKLETSLFSINGWNYRFNMMSIAVCEPDAVTTGHNTFIVIWRTFISLTSEWTISVRKGSLKNEGDLILWKCDICCPYGWYW